jgi:prepilin-type N-terminal cleavage/methylation domain-containing protein
MTSPARCRRGFTLIELLVAMVISAIIGVAMVRVIMSQTRFMDTQEAWRTARGVSRSSLNRLMSDLRMVEATNGLEAAAAGGKDFTVRVPYAFGVVCSSTASSITASLLPVDSTMFAGGGFSGFAVRASTGSYTYYTAGATLTSPGTASNCTGPAITTLPAIAGSPAGTVVNLGGTIAPLPAAGDLVFLFRRVRYEFKASVAVPGRTGLWRTLLGPNTTEELAAPFDTTARVRFYVLNGTVAQTAVPSPLSGTRGFEFVLDGMSEATPRGSPSPKVSSVTTSVFFQNRPD